MNHLNVTYTETLKKKSDTSDALQKLPMERLALGEITVPNGWLRRQLDAMTTGMTGRLPEYSPFFRKERNGFLDPAVENGWEEVPYWLRGFYPLAVLTENRELLATAQTYFEALFHSREEDGWFGPKYLKAYDQIDGAPAPDLFPHMMLLDALILYYEQTEDARVLELMEGFFGFCRDLSDQAFLPRKISRIKWQRIRAGDMLSSIYWYYQKTGEAWLLSLSKRFYDNIWESSMEYVAHHAVDFAQRFGYSAVYSRQSGDQADFARSEQYYEDFAKTWGQMPRGIFAADEQIREGCTDPRQGYEPCGMVELAKNFYEMGRISANTLYADRTEDVMLNHFPASFSPDYRQLHYLTSSNLPILTNYFYHPTYNGTTSGKKSYEIFTPNNRCCGHNTGMGWPWYVMNLWQKSADGGLVAWMYASCEVHTKIGEHPIALKVSTDYPFKGDVRVTVLQNENTEVLPLYFRIPGWNQNAKVSVNGEDAFESTCTNGYVRLCENWKAGDEITLSFGMRISCTRWESNGSVSVDRGPLTYSVRIPERWEIVTDAGVYNHPTPHLFENYEVYPTMPWNYGLCMENGTIEDCVSLSSEVTTLAEQPWTVEHAPVILKAKARRIPEWSLEDDMAGLLQPSPAYTESPVEEIELIPLGCARLRISCFPTVTDSVEKGVKWTPTPSHTPVEERTGGYPVPYLESKHD